MQAGDAKTWKQSSTRGGKGGKVRMYFGSSIGRLPDELGINGEANKGIKDYFQVFGMSNCGAISLR